MPLISQLISLYPPLIETPRNISKFPITPLLILCSFSHSLYSKNTSILLLISLNISLSTSFIKSHILESNTSYHYNLSSSSNNIHLPSYISLIHLTNYISHNFSINISHMYILQTHFSPNTHTYYSYKLQILHPVDTKGESPPSFYNGLGAICITSFPRKDLLSYY